MNKGLTNELDWKQNLLTIIHLSIRTTSLLPSPYVNTESNTYTDPETQERILLGNFDMEKIGVGVNLKYHLVNETALLPFLKPVFPYLCLLVLTRSKGMIVRNGQGTEVVRLKILIFQTSCCMGFLYLRVWILSKGKA
ncbi:MAG: hypothetical protein R3A12_09500 [Ignavibacteria bacterium]